MTRIDELQKKYPSIPKEVIVKWEVIRNGVKDTADLDVVSNWQRAGAHFSYQSYDHDITLKQFVDNRPSRLENDRILRPDGVYMKNGLGFAFLIDTSSPYAIRDMGDGKVALYEGEEKVDVDIFFIPLKKRTKEIPVTNKGNPATNLVSVKRRCFMIMPVRYCEYFASGEQCKFCNFNGTQEDSRSVGLDRSVTVNLDETVEAFELLSSETRLFEGRLEMGGFRSTGSESKIYFDFVEKIADVTSYHPNLTVHTQTMAGKDMQRLKDAGLDCLTIQVEVWDPDIFASVCPGKAKYSPHERWLESFHEAVDVFGPGNVGCAYVGGVTTLAANGHKTWQEARDSLIEGNRWMIKNGVMPEYTHVRIPPGSVYGADRAALWEKAPPSDYYLDAALAHHEAMMDYGLYPKLNKLMYCGFDCPQKIYCGEIGMLALAGDLGNWMSDVVPDEDNWLAQFISSVKAPAR